MKRRVRRFLRKHRTALIALGVYHFVFFFPLLFMGRVLSPNDVFYNFSPWQNVRPPEILHAQNSLLNDPPTAYYTLMSMAKEDWRTFHWNPYVACGIPGWGSSAAAVLSPFILIPVLLVPLTWVYTAIVFLKLNVAFVFSYLWLREERLGRRGAAIGAILVAAAGMYAVRWLWQITNATALYPAILWVVRRRRTSIASMTLIAVAFALSGFPAAIAYGAWMAIAYFAFLSSRSVARDLGGGRRVNRASHPPRSLATLGMTMLRGGAAVLLALMIAAPALVPFAQLIRRSGYLDVRREASVVTYSKEHWRNFLEPDRLGNPAFKDWSGDAQLGALGNYIETTIYLGILTIPLALFGIFNRRARARGFWLAAAALILACMFGAPVIANFVSKLPGFKYSALARVALLLPLPIGYLAAAGTRFFRRFGLAHGIAAILAFDLALLAGRFYPYLPPNSAHVPATPTTQFLRAEKDPFRIAPFFNYLWPNTAELVRVEDVRSHFGSEAAYRRMLQRIDPTSWSGTSTLLTFNSLQYRFDDPLNSLFGIRYFLEHRELDIIKWGIFKATVPGVKETGTMPLRPGMVLERTVRIEAEPFWSIEVPVNIEQGDGLLHVELLKNGRVVWSRAFAKAEANVMNKLYVPLRPYARYGESVTLRVRAAGVRGWILEAEDGGFFFGRVMTPVMFERELPDGRLFRNLAELPRFRAVSKLRKLNDDEFLAARDVDFEHEAVITDDPVMSPGLTPANTRVTLAHYAPAEQRVTTESDTPFFLASSEKLTPELQITIDGKRARAIETDMIFAGVTVPAGRHEVVFSRQLARGWWWVSIVGVVLWSASWGWRLASRAGRPPAGEAAGLTAGQRPALRFFRDQNNLIREQRAPCARDPHQYALAEAQEQIRRERSDDEADRHGRAAHREDAEAGVLDFAANRTQRVEAQVCVIEDAAVAVFENPQEQPEADGDIGDVRDGDEHVAVVGECAAHELQCGGRAAQVLEHIGEHDRAHVRREALDALEIGDHDLIEAAVELADAVDVVLEADRAIELLAHGRSELAAGGAEVEQSAAAACMTADQIDEDPMAAAFEILEGVDVRHVTSWSRARGRRCVRRRRTTRSRWSWW